MASTQNVKQAKILVVDDEELNLFLLEEILDAEGYSNVTFLSSPNQALEDYQQNTCDLILLDLKMPEIDGFEFMKHMREFDKPCPPILILTASADDETRAKVINMNAQGIISKPFDHDNILSVIEELVTHHWSKHGFKAQ